MSNCFVNIRKYQTLLADNPELKEENPSLKVRLGLAEPPESQSTEERLQQDASRSALTFPLKAKLDPAEKIRLFMSLFKGGYDVYAKRCEGKEGRSGYVPICLDEWQPGLCGKHDVKCSSGAPGAFAALNETIIPDHGRGNLVAGMYPMLQNEKCHFPVMDFDQDGWQEEPLQCVCWR